VLVAQQQFGADARRVQPGGARLETPQAERGGEGVVLVVDGAEDVCRWLRRRSSSRARPEICSRSKQCSQVTTSKLAIASLRRTSTSRGHRWTVPTPSERRWFTNIEREPGLPSITSARASSSGGTLMDVRARIDGGREQGCSPHWAEPWAGPVR
jgi:hypothetical protein